MTELQILRNEHIELMREFRSYKELRAHPIEALAFLKGILDRYDELLKKTRETR